MVFLEVAHGVGSLLATFALIFFFGHIWHGARTLFRDVFAGIDPDLDARVEFGAFQKLGDPSTKRQAVRKIFSGPS